MPRPFSEAMKPISPHTILFPAITYNWPKYDIELSCLSPRFFCSIGGLQLSCIGNMYLHVCYSSGLHNTSHKSLNIIITSHELCGRLFVRMKLQFSHKHHISVWSIDVDFPLKILISSPISTTMLVLSFHSQISWFICSYCKLLTPGKLTWS